MTWYLVQYSGQWGFVRADLVRVMGEQETAEYLAALEVRQYSNLFDDPDPDAAGHA